MVEPKSDLPLVFWGTPKEKEYENSESLAVYKLDLFYLLPFALIRALQTLIFRDNFNTNVTDSSSWITVTNIPAIAHSENAVTNPVSGDVVFYRLKK